MQKYPIPDKLQKEISADPWYSVCARKGLHGHECGGRITIEHAMTYTGPRLNKKWALIPLCAKAHNLEEYAGSQGDMNKEINQWIALCRSTPADLLEMTGEGVLTPFSKAMPFMKLRERLVAKWGIYVVVIPTVEVKPSIGDIITERTIAFIESEFDNWSKAKPFPAITTGGAYDFKIHLVEKLKITKK